MQQRTIFSIIIGVTILSLALFLLNSWLSKQNEGVFLTQDTYVGTVTWYEDATTPPPPSEFKDATPVISSLPQDTTPPLVAENTTSHDVLGIITAADKAQLPSLEPEVYDVNTGKFVKAPPQKTEKKIEKVVETPPVSQSQTKTPPKQEKKTKEAPAQETQSIKKIFLTKDAKRPLRIEASHNVSYTSFYLASPERIVIDIKGKLDISAVEKSIKNHDAIKDVRLAYNGDKTRLVIDLLKKPKDWSVVHGLRKSSIDILLRY